MADPYLALTFDAKRRIAQVAAALAMPHPGAMAWGLLELLEDVWRRKDPAVSALLLAACFGPDPRVPAALVEFRFLHARGDGWELCEEETERLLMAYRQRAAAGKARAAKVARVAGSFAASPLVVSTSEQTSGAPANNVFSAVRTSEQTSGTPALTASSQQPAASSQEDLAGVERPPPAVRAADLFSAPDVAEARTPAFTPQDLQALWNEGAKPRGLPRWESMPITRLRAARARLNEHPEREWWETVLDRASRSPFLCGENDRGWRLGPDTLLRPGRAESILEGKYDGKKVA